MGMKENQKLQRASDQRGMAAIMITVILMIVISIIVLGFAQVVQREQRNSLDNQLSTQAYYAAESGVNLAQSRLTANPALPEKTTCAANATFTAADYLIGEEAAVTCLLISKKLPTLEYQNVDMHSVPMLIQADAGAGISEITVSWESPTSLSMAGCAASGEFPASPVNGGNCQPVLRLDLLPVTVGMTAASAASTQFTSFLYPAASSVPITYAAGSVQGINNVRCDASATPKKCNAVITVNGANQYVARVMSVYGESNVTVTAKSSGSAVKLINGQVLIDVTAKASDVLKRIQARMSLTTPVPDFAITSGGTGICKRYQKIGSTISVDGVHPACNIP